MDHALTCATFERRLYHFQADELPEAERSAMSAHLDACPACARRLDLEAGLLRSVKSGLRRVEPPPGLLDRVQAALDEEAVAAGPSRWLSAPWVGALAASVLLAAVLIWDLGLAAAPAVRSVTIEATVVDRDCDMAGFTLEQQRSCEDPEHLNALRIGPGEYWSVSQDEAGSRALAVDREQRGRRLEIQGDYYPRIRTIRIRETRDLGLADLSAHRHRRLPDRADRSTAPAGALPPV